jgi:ABC-type transporter Mla MlaB component
LSSLYETSGETLSLNGELVLVNVAKFEKALSAIDLSSLKKVDLSRVTRLDSAGIALLLTLRQKTQSLMLVHAPMHLVTMLDLYNLTSQFERVET